VRALLAGGVAVALVALVAACTPEPAPYVPRGFFPDAAVAPPDAAAPRVASPVPADFRTRFAKLNAARFLTKGHLFERFAVDLYANESGKDAYDGKAQDVPIGAMLVKEHFDRTVTGDRPGPVMAMEKRERGFDVENGDWRYIVVSAAGEVVADGKGERCSGCHREAPHDHLFKAAE
jgi:hypothetical protein